MVNYAQLSLDNVMMHQILRAGANERGFLTVLTDVPVELSAQEVGYLEQRFRASLANRALPIVQDTADPHPARSAILGLWGTEPSLTTASQALAESLASTQPGSAVEGLLVVASGTLGREDALVIAKVEHQEAMRLEPTRNENGKNVFTVELIRDLVFGDKTRIFKVAAFVKSWSATGTLTGEAVDEQSDRSIAAYFLGKFLGMKLREEPSVLTESLLHGFTVAINGSSMTGEQKSNVQSALIAELRSNERSIDPHAFVRKHVPAGHAKEIVSLASAARAPMVVFSKDTSRIDSHMRRVRLNLEKDITLVAPPQEIGEGGAIQVHEDGDTSSVIISGARVESIRPGAR